MSALPAAAQTLPNGSYQQTCRSISLIDGTLVAECRMADQTWRATTLPNAAKCTTDISNINGKLQCIQAQAARPTTENDEGYGVFGVRCDGKNGAEYLVLRPGGRSDKEVKIVFDKRYQTKIHIFMTKGTTVAADCGGFPAPASPFYFKELE